MKAPRLITLTFSTVCNQDCVFCGRTKIVSADLDMLGRVNELIRPGATIDITGRGEILLHPQFRDAVDEITSRGAKISLSTNGTTLDPEVVDYLLGRSISFLNVSVNSLDPETHHRLTRRTFLPVLLRNLEYLFSRPRIMRVTLSMVLTSLNWTEMPALVRYGADHGADAVRLLALAPSIPYDDPGLVLPDTQEVRDTLAEALRIGKERKIRVWAPSLDGTRRGCSPRCLAPWNQFRVDMDGSVKTCCWSDRVLGDITTQRWREIWEGPLWEDFRNSVETGAMTYCQQCREFG